MSNQFSKLKGERIAVRTRTFSIQNVVSREKSEKKKRNVNKEAKEEIVDSNEWKGKFILID
jgi:hypothetical protein